MSKVQVFDHPLVQHKLSIIRDENTGSKIFRELVEEVAMLMTYEVTRDFPTEEVEVKTPVGPCCNKGGFRKKGGNYSHIACGLGYG
jgi:uracil phosphoribosyltransferase